MIRRLLKRLANLFPIYLKKVRCATHAWIVRPDEFFDFELELLFWPIQVGFNEFFDILLDVNLILSCRDHNVTVRYFAAFSYFHQIVQRSARCLDNTDTLTGTRLYWLWLFIF